jgi:hypothetical protein
VVAVEAAVEDHSGQARKPDLAAMEAVRPWGPPAMEGLLRPQTRVQAAEAVAVAGLALAAVALVGSAGPALLGS